MKITVWLATRERATYITAAELLGLFLVLFWAPGGVLRFVIGVPLLAHVGYTALTGLPMGAIPRRPEASKEIRQNLDLRSAVIGFLNDVRRVEAYAQRARAGKISTAEARRTLTAAQARLTQSAAEVAKAVGRTNVSPDEAEGGGTGTRSILTHAKPTARGA